MTGAQPLQPLLNDAVILLAAPSQAWSDAGGDMGSAPIHGFYHSDTRVLSELVLRIGGVVPEGIAHAPADASSGTFISLARTIDDAGADPRVRVERHRAVADGSMREEIVLSSALAEDVSTVIELEAAADFAPMQAVKAGVCDPLQEQVVVSRDAHGVTFRTGSVNATFRAEGSVVEPSSGDARRSGRHRPGQRRTSAATDAPAEARLLVRWPVTVPAGGSVAVRWEVTAQDAAAVVAGAAEASGWDALQVRTGDWRLAAWVRSALGDLEALRMTATAVPGEPFLAAGAPWFFTLFGRDSIWSARFLLPLGTEVAASTLRVLAALQGTKSDPETAEQPGKIMHELRPGTLTIPGEDIELPPLYYGTVDATALWVCLLHDAWRWGMPHGEIEALLPNLEAALEWMRDYGDSDGDGFLEYIDESGRGLANQGWKDSGDSIQWRDGTLAAGPIALCEVQGYAYEAAIGGAQLLDRFGRDGGAGWREWAGALKQRFAENFWIDSPDGAYPAVALDAAKRRVDTVTSNIGHLLGTGILDHRDAELVARRLASPALDSGYGLRTMSTDSAGYWPLGYHSGSVWTHDTAIAISGLAGCGFQEEAARLIEGLLSAADGFGYRMPELHSGDSAAVMSVPVPYPAACRPQAWSAAASVAVLAAALGLQAEDGKVRTNPIPQLGSIEVQGLRYAGRPFSASS